MSEPSEINEPIIRTEIESWLLIKGLAAYMLYGRPTEKEKEVIFDIFSKLEKSSIR